MISAINGPRIMADSGLQAMEARMRQIEGLIGTVEAQKAALGQTATLPPAPVAGVETAQGPTPFQFYLGKAQQAAAKSPAHRFQPVIQSLSQQYGLDPNLVNAVIRQESGFNPQAVSSAGAQGLMQLMPATAKALGVSNPQDPAQNLEGGIRYLKGLMDQFNGNIPLALAAYNAGPGAVKRHKGIPPYKETQQYVRTILSNYLQARQEQSG